MPDEIYSTSTEFFSNPVIYPATDTSSTTTQDLPIIDNQPLIGESLIGTTSATSTDYNGISALFIIGILIILGFNLIRVVIKRDEQK